ncbi:MAG: RidA family protein [Pseudomonadota bacterium]
MHRKTSNRETTLKVQIGFSRAVRIGNVIAVSGTAPIAADGTTIGVGNLYAQTKACLDIGLAAITELGASAHDVIRTRIMLTDIAQWEDAAKAHGEVFADIQPACTFVEVKGFIRPDWHVETEIDAVCES